MPFLILFILIPLAEVYAFITVGEEIGVLKTLLLCVLTAAIGGFLVRQQGIETLMKAQHSIRTGTLPLDALFDGICLVIAGALLLTPGFVTDMIGFSLLIPAARRGLRQILTKYGKFEIYTNTEFNQKRPNNDDIIEGNYEEIVKNPDKIGKK